MATEISVGPLALLEPCHVPSRGRVYFTSPSYRTLWLPCWIKCMKCMVRDFLGRGNEKQCGSRLVLAFRTQPPHCEEGRTNPHSETMWKGRVERFEASSWQPTSTSRSSNKQVFGSFQPLAFKSSSWGCTCRGAEISQLHSALSKFLTHGIVSILRGCFTPFWGNSFHSDSDWNADTL